MVTCQSPQFCGSGRTCIGGSTGPTNTPGGATNTPTLTPLPGSTDTPTLTPVPTVTPGPTCFAPQGEIQGFYSTDKSFIIQSKGGCPTVDLYLGIEGAIVVNADGKSGGTFTNNRTLCAGNANNPVFTIKERPDMILNAPNSYKITNFLYTEIAP